MDITKNKCRLAVFNLVFLLLSVSAFAYSGQSKKEKNQKCKHSACNCKAVLAKENKDDLAGISIVFDSIGKIINGYPQYVKTDDNLLFDLRAITNRLDKANKDFIEKLDAANKVLQDTVPKQNSQCCFPDIKPTLNSFFNRTSILENSCMLDAASNAWYNPLKQQYENIAPLVLTFKFKYNGKNLEPFDISITLEDTKEVISYKVNKLLLDHDVKRGAKNLEVEISLKEINRINIVTRNFFDALKKQKVAFYPYQQLISQKDIGDIKSDMDKAYYKILTALILNSSNDQCCNAKNIDDLTTLLTEINSKYCNKYKIAETVICKNIPWLVNTAWLTGEPKFNPLGLISEGGLTESIDNLTLKNKLLKMQLATTDTLMLRCRLLDCADEIKAIANNKETLLKQLLENEDAITENTATIAANQKRQSALDEESKVLNQWKYFVSNPHEVFIMRNHDAANKLEMVDQWTPFKQLSYAQDEKVRIVSYNINELAKLGFGETTVQIAQEQSVFTETFLESTNGFADALRDLKNINLETALPDFLFDSLPAVEKAKRLLKFEEAEKCFITNYSRFMWLSKQSSPVTDYKLAKRGALLYTDVQTPNKKNKIPALVQYQLSTTEGTPPKTFSTDSFAYKVYRKLFVQVAAGISLPLGVGDASRFNTVYNQNNGTFTSTALKPYDVMLAIKVFPMGLNIRRWFPSARSGRYGNMLVRRGDHVVNRLSLIFGMGVSQSQLKNYFAGVGFEIVPGLGINTGVNMYGQNYYQVENGALISQEQRFKPAPFIAFTVDPVVMIRASNLFNFKF